MKVRIEITNQIVAALKAGIVPWRQPWRLHENAGPATSMASGKPYPGINILRLDLHSMRHDLSSRWWGTFNQIKALGGSVKKRPDNVLPGQWGCQILLLQARLMRKFVVFNADQCEGEAMERFQVKDEKNTTLSLPDFGRVSKIIVATKANIRHGSEQAFYARPKPYGSWPNHTSGDLIRMPQPSRFVDVGAYWETLLHEMAHWAEWRIDWELQEEGDEIEETVAELASCFLAAELGVPHGQPLDNHAAYIRACLGPMTDDFVIFRAARQASKVTDFILSHEEPT
jgi:antirestriction protein ArdC